MITLVMLDNTVVSRVVSTCFSVRWGKASMRCSNSLRFCIQIVCIWGAGGATPGKFLIGLRVVTCDSSVLVQPNRVLVVPATNVSLSAWVIDSQLLLAACLPSVLTYLFFFLLQIDGSSLEQELFNCLLFPSLHHTSVLPAQPDCIWYGSWNYCCQALQSQMMQRSSDCFDAVQVLCNVFVKHTCRTWTLFSRSEHAGRRVWYTSVWKTSLPLKLVAIYLRHILYFCMYFMSTCCFMCLFLCQTGVFSIRKLKLQYI